LKDESISGAIKCFLENKNYYDTLNSAHLVKEFMWFDGKPINYELDKMPKSQNLPNIYALNFALNIFEKD
jgi:CMP-N-acetylneuraminic acid synthetase